MNADDRHEIMEVKSFMDASGKEVRQFTQVFGKSKQEPFYKGIAMAVIQQKHPAGIPMQPITRPFEFLLPKGTGLKRAFEIFDEEARKALEGIRKKEEEAAMANRVVRAGALPTLLGPDGKKV